MRNRTLAIALAAVFVAAFCSAAVGAAKLSAAKPAVAKPAKFDQKAELMKYWTAPDSAVVGSVNGAKVTKGELVKTLWLWNAPAVLQDLLNQKLVEQAAAKAKVTVTSADMKKRIEDSLKRMGMDSIDQLLGQFRITWYRFESGTKVNTLAEKTVEKSVKVTDAELADWIKARHILVRFPQEEKDKAKQEEIAKKKIDEIAAKLKAGDDFAKLADEYSEDPGNAKDGAKQGGDLGWFSRGRMVKEFEDAAFTMKAGQVSEPVKTPYGYHIIKVEKLGKDATPAEKAELRKQIMTTRIPTEMSRWFGELQQGAKIDNKLSGPAPKPPAQGPAMGPPPRPRPIAPKTAPATEAPKTEAPKPSDKPGEPPAGEKPEAPPPPPPAPAN